MDEVTESWSESSPIVTMVNKKDFLRKFVK